MGKKHVFFYKDENVNLAGKCLPTNYKEVYNNAWLMVCFATRKYREALGEIIRIEKKIALARFEQRGTVLVVFEEEEIRDWQAEKEHGYLKVEDYFLKPENLASALVGICKESKQQDPQKTKYAYLLYLKGEYEEALKEFPKRGLTYQQYNNLGVIKRSLGKNEEAIKDYNSAIELNPDCIKAHYNRGNAKLKLGDWVGPSVTSAVRSSWGLITPKPTTTAAMLNGNWVIIKGQGRIGE